MPEPKSKSASAIDADTAQLMRDLEQGLLEANKIAAIMPSPDPAQFGSTAIRAEHVVLREGRQARTMVQ